MLCAMHSLSRAAIALPVLGMAFVSFWVSPEVRDSNPDYYFIVAAVMNAMVVAFLQIPRQTKLNIDIQIINGVAIIGHLYGHALWHFGVSATSYNAIILLLGVTEFARLIYKTRMDARDYGARSGYDFIRSALGFRGVGDS